MNQLLSWRTIKAAIADSYDSLDCESMADLASIIIGGKWEYDAETELFTQTEGGNND